MWALTPSRRFHIIPENPFITESTIASAATPIATPSAPIMAVNDTRLRLRIERRCLRAIITS